LSSGLREKTYGNDSDSTTACTGATFTFEDDRFDYGEDRFITLGMLAGEVVVIAHTERGDNVRIISMRKATSLNRNSTSRASQTDWDYVATLQDEDIDLSDIPEVTAEQMARARLRVGGQPVPQGKVQVSMLLDAAVVAYFKAQAGERDYQTLINEVLKASIYGRDLEATLRRVLREELAAVK
jgi:uncharacterized DUF497 family protein